jgi:hypothetical protein
VDTVSIKMSLLHDFVVVPAPDSVATTRARTQVQGPPRRR